MKQVCRVVFALHTSFKILIYITFAYKMLAQKSLGMKNTLKNSANEFALTDFTDNLMDSLMELGRNIVKEVVEITEEAIYESESRKKYYSALDKKEEIF